MHKTHVHTGDTVKVISGNHRGAQGKIIRVIREKNQVFIEGVRMIKKHLGRSQDRPQGEIIEKEGPLHISNVKLIEAAASGGATKSATKKSTKKATSSKVTSSTAEEPKKKTRAKKASAAQQED